MWGFGPSVSSLAAGMHPGSALSGIGLRNWRRWPGVASVTARAAAAVLIAALLATAALVTAVGLRSGVLSAWTNALALPQGRIIAPADNRHFEWIARAIAQCEVDAVRNPDTLYFLVIPVLTTDGDQEPWLAKSNGMIGGSIILLGSRDTIDGLGAGS